MSELKININARKIENCEIGLPKFLCRTMYCPHCDKYQKENIGNIQKDPERQELYALHGANNGLRVQSFGGLTPQSGMTPHLISVDEIIDLNGDIFVFYIAFCSINGCGVTITIKNQKSAEIFFKKESSYNFLEIKDFSQKIVNNKNPSLYI